VPVIIGSIVDSEDIISAMELRCFGVARRTWLIQLHPHRIDAVLITLSLSLLIILVVLNILGWFIPLHILDFLHNQGIPHFLVP
jgi:energy-coupling factor transport system permease protein